MDLINRAFKKLTEVQGFNILVQYGKVMDCSVKHFLATILNGFAN